MAEYIEREKLLKKFCNHCYFDVGEKDCAEDCFDVKIIKSIPSADVQPVKHGRWIDNGICDSMLSACSICGYPCGAYSFNYCPNCGADMREKS